jgi:uridine kinase
MEISIRVSGGRATGKTTLLKHIRDMIEENFVVTEYSFKELAEPIPEEVITMTFFTSK